MGVSLVIYRLLIIVWSLFVVTSQNVQNQNETSAASALNTINVASEGGTVVLSSNNETQKTHDPMIKVHHTQLPKNENGTTHLGREHMIAAGHPQSVTKFPAYEVGQKNDNKMSVPKKDAVLSKSTSTTTTTTTTTATTTTTSTTTTTTTTTTSAPSKPTVTIGEDEEPLSSNTKTQSNDTNKHGISIESVTEKNKKTDYVVPIVAVILSVPLVAIVFSVLYKRGSDWWQHRHYRRMDFLIEGMYNN